MKNFMAGLMALVLLLTQMDAAWAAYEFNMRLTADVKDNELSITSRYMTYQYVNYTAQDGGSTGALVSPVSGNMLQVSKLFSDPNNYDDGDFLPNPSRLWTAYKNGDALGSETSTLKLSAAGEQWPNGRFDIQGSSVRAALWGQGQYDALLLQQLMNFLRLSEITLDIVSARGNGKSLQAFGISKVIQKPLDALIKWLQKPAEIIEYAEPVVDVYDTYLDYINALKDAGLLTNGSVLKSLLSAKGGYYEAAKNMRAAYDQLLKLAKASDSINDQRYSRKKEYLASLFAHLQKEGYVPSKDFLSTTGSYQETLKNFSTTIVKSYQATSSEAEKNRLANILMIQMFAQVLDGLDSAVETKITAMSDAGETEKLLRYRVMLQGGSAILKLAIIVSASDTSTGSAGWCQSEQSTSDCAMALRQLGMAIGTAVASYTYEKVKSTQGFDELAKKLLSLKLVGKQTVGKLADQTMRGFKIGAAIGGELMPFVYDILLGPVGFSADVTNGQLSVLGYPRARARFTVTRANGDVQQHEFDEATMPRNSLIDPILLPGVAGDKVTAQLAMEMKGLFDNDRAPWITASAPSMPIYRMLRETGSGYWLRLLCAENPLMGTNAVALHTETGTGTDNKPPAEGISMPYEGMPTQSACNAGNTGLVRDLSWFNDHTYSRNNGSFQRTAQRWSHTQLPDRWRLHADQWLDEISNQDVAQLGDVSWKFTTTQAVGYALGAKFRFVPWIVTAALGVSLLPVEGGTQATLSASHDGAAHDTVEGLEVLDWGDGTGVTLKGINSHVYTTAGSYTVTAKVYTKSKQMVMTQKVVTVSAPPVIKVDKSPVGVAEQIWLWVENLYEGIARVLWKLGDGLSDVLSSVVNGVSERIGVSYGTPGVRKVTVEYQDANGKTVATGETTVTVTQASVNTTAAITDVRDDKGNAITNGGTTTDSTPLVSGTISAPLTGGQVVTVYDGTDATPIGQGSFAPAGGTVWTLQLINALTNGSHNLRAVVRDTYLSIEGSHSNTWVFIVNGGINTSKLPHTGITSNQCYQAGSDTLVDCTGSATIALSGARKQDGMYTDLNPMSYGLVPNTSGGNYPLTSCVTDKVTGLIWEGKEASGIRSGSNAYTNYDSTYTGGTDINVASNAIGYVNYVNSISLCGYTDWRLPSIEEIESLVDASKHYQEPAINTDWFLNAPNWAMMSVWWRYLTSSPDVSASNSAWVIYGDGTVNSYYRSARGMVRLVRGAPPRSTSCPSWPTEERFMPRSSGSEVFDARTGLTWARCSVGQRWDSVTATCSGTASTYTHEGALQYVANMSGWRLPNRRELSSLVDRGCISPAIDSAAFPNVPSFANYWSSTPFLGYSSSYPWSIRLQDGALSPSSYARRNGYLNVRLVRGSQ